MTEKTEKMKEDVTNVDIYTPPLGVRRFCDALFDPKNGGEKTKAQKASGINRQTFYKLYSMNVRFRQWFDDRCRAFTEALAPRAVATLYESMSEDKDPYVRLKAVETWGKIAGRIGISSIKIDNSRNVSINLLELIKKSREVEYTDS